MVVHELRSHTDSEAAVGRQIIRIGVRNYQNAKRTEYGEYVANECFSMQIQQLHIGWT